MAFTDKSRAGMRATARLRAFGQFGRLRAFARDESGVMIAYSIFFFLIILLVAGIGVDLMRYEMQRTRLQATLDRAVLAAADMQQTRDPATVVQDYLAAAGLENVTLGTPNVTTGINMRAVDATASMPMNTQFMHMMGVDTLITPALAGAEEAIDGIEVVLVLDVSGSMNQNDRLVNLKPAAREFVDTVLGLAEPGKVTISVVPYNTQVGLPPALMAQYNTTSEHSYSNCINFEAADFNSTALSTAQPFERTAHFDVFTSSSGWSLPPAASALALPVCTTLAPSLVLPMSDNQAALDAKINALVGGGNTSIDVAMKWASALVDPGSQPVISALIANGDVSAANAGRPVAFDAPGVLKVIVVMTDGQNTSQYMLRDDLRSGMSDVWFNDAQNRYSVRMSGGPEEYYWVGDDVWRDHPYGNEGLEPGTAVQLSYPELFALNSTWRLANNIYAPAYVSLHGAAGTDMARDDWHTNAREFVPGGTKDIRLQNICTAAKGNDVLIYSIGFEATANGETQMRNCATSPSHFFDVDGTEISDAFQAIAASIAQLRLTQ